MSDTLLELSREDVLALSPVLYQPQIRDTVFTRKMVAAIEASGWADIEFDLTPVEAREAHDALKHSGCRCIGPHPTPYDKLRAIMEET